LEYKGIRKYPRISANFPAEFTFDGKTFRQRATTLGGGGLFVTLKDPPPVGTELLLRFRPARHLGFIETRARVVYHDKDGAALEFLDISPQEQQILLRLIHHKTGNRREHPRAKLATQVEWQGLSSLALSRDVSAGGMFVETTDQPTAGSKIKLRFHLEDGGQIVEATAQVSYTVSRMGMGVRFMDMELADRERIERYINEHPALLAPGPNAAVNR
jgi:c-di-GMP-binding flagellar brake protein YcgR